MLILKKIAKMKNDMKPSRIEWIGDIPVEWNVSKIKHLFSIVSGSTPDSDNEEYWDGDIPWITPADMSDFGVINRGERSITKKGYNACGATLLPLNSIVLSTRAPIGKINITESVLCTNQGCKSLVNTHINTRYYYYLLFAGQEELIKQGRGTTFLELGITDLGNIRTILPPLPRQQVIASFLDAQCEKIDGIITAMEQQIEVLKQYKTSLITETVTKGLDKSAPMKDSGIEWIGKIPAHWKIEPVKYNLKSNEKTLKETTESDYIMRYVDISSVNFDNGITAYEEISFENAPSRARRIVKKGDTIISTVRTYLKAIARISDDKDVIVSTGFAVLSPRGNDPAFIEYFCKSDGFCSEIEKFSYGIAYPAINESVLINIKMLVPPISEQKVIAAYLEAKCAEMTAIISEKQKSIETMKSYKKSLIYEYVTGKKRVKL
jgi:type I restriction enzyme S subunit